MNPNGPSIEQREDWADRMDEISEETETVRTISAMTAERLLKAAKKIGQLPDPEKVPQAGQSAMTIHAHQQPDTGKALCDAPGDITLTDEQQHVTCRDCILANHRALERLLNNPQPCQTSQ